jgi:hypothetical protein
VEHTFRFHSRVARLAQNTTNPTVALVFLHILLMEGSGSALKKVRFWSAKIAFSQAGIFGESVKNQALNKSRDLKLSNGTS